MGFAAGCSRVEEGIALQGPSLAEISTGTLRDCYQVKQFLGAAIWNGPPVGWLVGSSSSSNQPWWVSDCAVQPRALPPCCVTASGSGSKLGAQMQQRRAGQLRDRNRPPDAPQLTNRGHPLVPPIYLPGVPPPVRVRRRHVCGLHLPLLPEASIRYLEPGGAGGGADHCGHQLPLAAAAAQVWVVVGAGCSGDALQRECV